MKKSADIFLLLLAAWVLFRRTKAISGPIKTKTRFAPVYIDGKPNPALIRANYKKPGVYLIKVNGELSYVGYSSTNVYKTILRHFQSWEDRYQVRVTYPKASYVTARIVYTSTGAQAAQLEKALIIKYKPKDNPNKLEQYELDLKDEKIVEAYNYADLEPDF